MKKWLDTFSLQKRKKKPKKYTFVLRNEIVVALSELLIVTEADINSGSLTSVNYALKWAKMYIRYHTE